MIICLGWGSLIWCPGNLPTVGDWHRDGPHLPIEFARQSRDDRITLVIEDCAGLVPVLWTRLQVLSVDEARIALAKRENVCLTKNPQSIGHWSLKGWSDHKETETIGRWCKDKDAEGVVWTALKPRFNHRQTTPTCEEVIAHFRSLGGEAKERAEEYVRKAPLQIRTAFRDVIEQELD